MGSTLTVDQQKKAQDIFVAFAKKQPLRRDPDYEQKYAALTDDRNTKFLALVMADADKARITDNLAKLAVSPYRCDRPTIGR